MDDTMLSNEKKTTTAIDELEAISNSQAKTKKMKMCFWGRIADPGMILASKQIEHLHFVFLVELRLAPFRIRCQKQF